jgi:pyrroline-5-carboxylate reductase
MLDGLSRHTESFADATVISIAAGITAGFICRKLKKDFPVIRAMPGTPVLIGEGAIAVCRNHLVNDGKFGYIKSLFARSAAVADTTEDKMNAVVAVNGSSPAYVYLFVKAMLDGAEALGIDAETALPLVLRTVKGSAEMIRRSDRDIETLIRDVAVPNGTTEAALKSLREDRFGEAVKNAMRACAQRAEEITDEHCSTAADS